MTSVPSANELIETSERWVKRACVAWWVEDSEDTPGLAGVALEHLLKAFLCDMSPVLIVETPQKPFDSLLGALGLGHLKKTPGKPTLTISASEAWDRTLQVHPFEFNTDSIVQLFSVRNGTLHAGTVTGVVRRRMFTQFLRVSLDLRQTLNPSITIESMLGEPYSELAIKLLAEDREHLEKDVQSRFVAAQRKLRDQLAGISSSEVANERRRLQEDERAKYMLVHLPQGPGSDEAGWFINTLQPVKCPTADCRDENATAAGWTHYTDDGDVLFHAAVFSCGVCGLRLPSPDHISTAGLSRYWRLDDEEPLSLSYGPADS